MLQPKMLVLRRLWRKCLLLPAHRRTLHDLNVCIGRAADWPIPAVLSPDIDISTLTHPL